MKFFKNESKRILSIAVGLAFVLSMIPMQVFAASTPTNNDWLCFENEAAPPMTEEQLIHQMMVKYPGGLTDTWYPLAWSLSPLGHAYRSKHSHATGDQNTTSFPIFTTGYLESDFGYSRDGIKAAVQQMNINSTIRNESGILNNLPEEKTNVYYRLMHNEDEIFGKGGKQYTYTGVLIYDIKVEGKPESFKAGEVKTGDTVDDLKNKGFTFSKGEAEDSYTATLENKNIDTSNVEKAFTYEKSTTTSTSVSTGYTENWSEETSVGIDFDIPILGPSMSVEQSFSYNYGMEKTYTNSEEKAYKQSVTDSLNMELPPHSSIDIDVNTEDKIISIPYDGEARLKFKVKYIYIWGDVPHNAHPSGHYKTVTYGGNICDNAKDEYLLRYENRDIPGYDPDGITAERYNDLDFVMENIKAGDPYAPYKGEFHYKTTGTKISAKEIKPLYPLDKIKLVDSDEITLYEQQEKRLDTIKLHAVNQYMVPYYGFNPSIHGQWKVVDVAGNENKEYATVEEDRNGNVVLKTSKPTGEEKLFLRYDPDQITDKTNTFRSDTIALNIKPKVLSNVTLNGEFPDNIILDDSTNSIDARARLSVTALDNEGNNFDTSHSVKWYAEAANGITVGETDGSIVFTEPGVYQIYAVVNNVESNRVALEVLPKRAVETIEISGNVPEMKFNASDNKFNLDNISKVAKDQYGQVFDISGIQEWVVEPVDGVKFNPANNTFEVLKPGTYNIKLKAGEVESNILVLKVWPEQNASGGGIFMPIPNVDKDTMGNPDGSITKTETLEDGTVVETTTGKPDGSTNEKTTKPDGTTIDKTTDKEGNIDEKTTKPDGTTIDKFVKTDGLTTETTTTKEGKVTAEVTVPEGQKNVKVTIPKKDLKPGEVAVITKADGSREVIKKSAVGEDGLKLVLDENTKLEIVDNSKDFNDVKDDNWAKPAIDFVTSREIFDGTGEETFAPEATMTRGMLVQVLYNFENRPEGAKAGDFGDVKGDAWFADAVAWAADNKIVSGVGDGNFAPNDEISREQLVTILYRYAGEPKPAGSLDKYSDASKVSSYAQDAMLWAVENGIVSGMGDNTLAPQGDATRAQVAQIMMNFCDFII